jgi:hypothetical protein
MVRRLMLLVVVALLLRGWVGEAMAGQMLAQQLQLPSTHAAALHSPDCPGSVEGEDGEAAADQGQHCQDCTLHALTAAPLALPWLQPASRVLPRAPAFASAERLPGDKPPIS